MLRPILAALLACALLAPAVQAQTAPTPSAEYRLQSGDSFDVLYRLTPEYNQTVTVQPNGAVSLPLLGSVPVGGLTVEEAKTRIRKEAGKHLNRPEVSLTLRDFDGPHFTVIGEVANPGRYALRGSISTVDGVAMAGGLKPSARHTKILLIHRVNQTIGETHLLDFKALEKPRPGQELIRIQDGDLIIVPQNKLSKVERFVRLSNIGVYYPL